MKQHYLSVLLLVLFAPALCFSQKFLKELNSIEESVTLNDITYFVGADEQHGKELWKTDGTRKGTVMVKDILPGSRGSEVQNLFVFKGAIYFSADDGILGSELYKTDGTKNGTVLVKDIQPYPRVGSQPGNFAIYNDELFFSASPVYSSAHNLYKTDGTAEGTQLVHQIMEGGSGVYTSLTVANDKLYFRKPRNPILYEYTASSGTVTSRTIDEFMEVNYLRSVNNDLYFITHTNYRQKINLYCLKSSGELILLKNFEQSRYGNLDLQYLTPVGDLVYFSILNDDGSDNYTNHLYSTDGTPENTKLITTYPWARHSSGSAISNFIAFKNSLYFNGGQSNNYQLMQSDGTAVGTKPVHPNLRVPVMNQAPLVIANELLYFASGNTVWATDGTEANTKQQSNLYLSRDNTGQDYYLKSDGQKVYFKTNTLSETYTHPKHLYSTEANAQLSLKTSYKSLEYDSSLQLESKKDSLITIPLELTNTGRAPLHFSGIKVTGGEFYLKGDHIKKGNALQEYFPKSIEPGEYAVFNLLFFPSTSGFQKERLEIYSNDSKNAVFVVNLNSYTTEEQATANSGLVSFEQRILFEPGIIQITDNRFSEKSEVGTDVGVLSLAGNSTDYDFKLVAGSGGEHNAYFKIIGNQLSTNASDFDAALQNTLSIRVEAKNKNSAEVISEVLILNVEPSIPGEPKLQPCPLISQSITYELRDIEYLNENEAVAVGSHGMILKSYDRGLNWSQKHHKGFSNLTKLQFINESLGYAFGDYAIYKTRDGGETWSSLENPIRPFSYPTNMLFVNEETGFIMGGDSPVYKTIDGGKNWRVVQDKYKDATTGFFINNQKGFLCGNSGDTLWKTTDGGESWELVLLNLEASFNRKFVAVYFTTDQKGLLFDNKGNVYASTDGGSTWAFKNAIESAPLSVLFSSENSGYVATSGKIYKTEDGGESWIVDYDNFRLDLIGMALSKDGQRMLGVGQGSYDSRNIIASKDVTTDWQITSQLFSYHNYPVSDFSGELGFHASENGIHITRDGGITWQTTNKPDDYNFSAIEIVENSIFLQGSAALYKSTDFGENWQVVPTPQNTEIVHIINENNLLLSGRSESAAIYKTTDGGISYTEVYPENFYIRKAQFLDANNGIIIGFKELLITKDGGNTWAESKITTDSEGSFLRSAAMYNTDIAIVGSDRGIIYKTYDGGVTWERIPTIIRWSTEFLFAKSELEWYAIDGAYLYKSIDGGYTWQEELQLQDDFRYYQLDDTTFYFTGSGTKLFKVLLSEEPPRAPAFLEGPTQVKTGSTTAYSVIREDNHSYVWEVSGNQKLQYQNNTARITWDAPGTYELSVTPYTSCSEGEKQTYTVKVVEMDRAAPVISGPTELSEFAVANTYSVEPKSGSTYQWLAANALNIASDQNTVQIDWGAAHTGTVQVIETDTATGYRFTNALEVNLQEADPPQIQAWDATCIDKNNGVISITTGLNLDYTAHLTNYNSPNTGKISKFRKNLKLENLSPGRYSLCFMRHFDQVNYCYTVEIQEPEAFSAKTNASKSNAGKVDISMQGGTKPYTVYINGKEVARTHQESLSLDAKPGDYLEITSSGGCAIAYSEQIPGASDIAIYPNPSSGWITVDFGTTALTLEQKTQLSIYTVTGILVKRIEEMPQDGTLKIDLSDQPSGLYLLEIHGDPQNTFKLVKQ